MSNRTFFRRWRVLVRSIWILKIREIAGVITFNFTKHSLYNFQNFQNFKIHVDPGPEVLSFGQFESRSVAARLCKFWPLVQAVGVVGVAGDFLFFNQAELTI